MFKELKEMLINQVDCIVELLELYGFEDIRWTHRELRFKRDNEGGMNISIKLDNNESLIVHDFARGISTDIFAYIVQEKDVKLGEVLGAVKKLLKLEDNWTPKKKIELFGGIYNRIVNKTSNNELLKEYPASILNSYDLACNERFRKDGISYRTQREFGLMYDKESNRIVIPLYDELGRLVGVKGRINRSNIDEFTPKYLYLYECMASRILYGYYQNYQHLFGAEIVVGESEKMVMQAHSFGVKNVVGLGSNSLSEKQANLLLQMAPKKIIFALDEGLDISQTERNVNILRSCIGINTFEVWYWDYTKDLSLKGTKNSPTDMGKDKYNEILKNQLVRIM